MIKTERFELVQVDSAEDLRRWLKANHAQPDSFWLVTFKKHTGPAYLSRSDVLDELLCFGWVDGVARKLDAERTMQLISPRRADAWTKTYRERAELLVQAGRMQGPRQAAMARAKERGLWIAHADVDALLLAPDLDAALRARPSAQACFLAFAPSHRRNVLRWIAAAVRPATRAARIEKMATLEAEGQRVPQF
jgi:uncharacterized protein YdeI (YjbR/CyaY-like superfamily)